MPIIGYGVRVPRMIMTVVAVTFLLIVSIALIKTGGESEAEGGPAVA